MGAFDNELTNSIDDVDGLLDTKRAHVRKQLRRGRKWLTTIENLDLTVEENQDLLRKLRKVLSCNGVVVPVEENRSVLQLQGDHSDKIRQIIGKYLPEYEFDFHS